MKVNKDFDNFFKSEKLSLPFGYISAIYHELIGSWEIACISLDDTKLEVIGQFSNCDDKVSYVKNLLKKLKDVDTEEHFWDIVNIEKWNNSQGL